MFLNTYTNLPRGVLMFAKDKWCLRKTEWSRIGGTNGSMYIRRIEKNMNEVGRKKIRKGENSEEEERREGEEKVDDKKEDEIGSGDL